MKMEEVCLNSEPVFDESDYYEAERDSSAAEHDSESGETHLKKEPLQPTVGLEFDSFDEAYDFYNIYAKEKGFGIRVGNSWFRSKGKERYRAKLSCSSAGFKKKSEANNPRPETRTGCPAMVVIRLVDSKRWRIVEVELEHNHPVSPQIKRFYKSHKKMIIAARNAKPQQEPVTEIHTIKLYRTSLVDAGCHGLVNIDGMEGVSVNGAIVTYIVKERVELGGSSKEVKHFEVLYETSQADIRCICSLFNYKGYLCRHALNVLNYNGVEEIPSRYILPRWSKDYKHRFLLDKCSSSIEVYSTMYWYNHMYKSAIPVVEAGARSEENYKNVLQELDELLDKFNLAEENLV
ncbi:hypothetical protein Tsubulata_016235 [Turnera subulata]|uniref:Protein FAR1-RELATED SEQUENCE n=1 Tax=Turnera subulata TaxID=218843 RepID=A0A9Q0GH57_9ROSI|nr:hypothetical protein Tsubulata_016235 [Turnera subulata]